MAGRGSRKRSPLRSVARSTPVSVTGPVEAPVDAHFAMLAAQEVPTAVLEMAAASGLRHVPADQRVPLATTTRGVGELIVAALDRGARRTLVGCGDSGTSDGGAGMAQALGARFLDGDGRELEPGGGALASLVEMDLSGLNPRLAKTTIDVACNWSNVLTGPL